MKKIAISFLFFILLVPFISFRGFNKTGPGINPVENQYQVVTSGHYTLKDYASWINFDQGKWFTIFHLALPLPPWGDIIDKMTNSAFRYLVFGKKSDRNYFIKYQLALANKDFKEIFLGNTFDGGNTAHPHGDRIAQDLAEVYLAMRHTLTPAQRSKVEKWYHDFAWHVWENSNYAVRQGTKGGFMAVVGYMTGDTSMINKAREYFSFKDTWTIQEDSRHYAGLIMERMFRIEIFTNDFSFPQSSKANLARQMRWVLSMFPHNGYNPVWGACWIPNETDHFMECLIMASHFLKDYDYELAKECKWLAERMFEYGINQHPPLTEPVNKKNRIRYSVYDAQNQESYVYKMQANPIHLFWYLDETIEPQKPDINSYGSQVIYRLRAMNDRRDKVSDLPSFQHMIDKIVHRDSWEEDALFVMLDPVIPAAKNIGPGAGNSIASISYGKEEFITNKILNRFNLLYTQHSVADIPPDPRGNYNTLLECFTDNPEYSRSVTTLEGWRRTVTLYKTGDRRIEVEDYLPREGNVYWHLQGNPVKEQNKITLDIRGTKLEVTYSGHDNMFYQENDTWNAPDPNHRWGSTGNPDREVKLYRSTQGSVVTVFKPIKK